MFRFEGFPVVDAGSSAAGGKYVREKQRVRMAHRHDQKPQIVSTETPVDLREITLKNQAATSSNGALGLARCAGRVEQGKGIIGASLDRRFRLRARRDQVFIGAISWGRSSAEMDVLVS